MAQYLHGWIRIRTLHYLINIHRFGHIFFKLDPPYQMVVQTAIAASVGFELVCSCSTPLWLRANVKLYCGLCNQPPPS
jgi:hypothetical protein